MTFKATTQPQTYLAVRGGHDAIAFYEKAFGAEVTLSQDAEDGKRLMHATLAMLGGHVMISDEFPEHSTDVMAPASLNGTSVTIHINLADRGAVDAVMASANAAGARITMPAEKMFWGAYYGRIVDPFGHAWSFAAEH